MNWFRKHVKPGSRLALFALAIQFALSFGHFHGEVARAAPALQTGLADTDLAIAAALAAQDGAPHSSLPTTIPISQPPTCAICAVLSLANNFLFATPPLLELPQAVELLHLTTGAEFAHLGLAASARSSPAHLPSPDLD